MDSSSSGRATRVMAAYASPGVPLVKALYGHPDSGGYWEKHCETHVRSVGFEDIPAWRSCFWHPRLKLLLVVYADDFKLSGPLANLDKGWRLIRKNEDDPPERESKGITTGVPTGHGLYLGCLHEITRRPSPTGDGEVNVLEYNM